MSEERTDEREQLILDSARENCPDEGTWEERCDRLIDEARVITSGWVPKSEKLRAEQERDEALDQLERVQNESEERTDDAR